MADKEYKDFTQITALTATTKIPTQHDVSGTFRNRYIAWSDFITNLPTTRISDGVLFIKEQAEADADQAGYGQIWINTATPNELWWTDDAGTDVQLGQSGGLANVVEDLSPQLGADLEGQGFNLQEMGVIFLKEQAEADADVAGEGQIWVNTATPNELWFTDDAGTDVKLGNVIGTDVLAYTATNIEEQLTENAPLLLDAALSADGKHSGISIAGTAGAALAYGELCYFQAADSRWELVDADAAATSGPLLLGFCVLAAAGDASATEMLLHGNIRADTAFPALTIGAPVYAGITAGAIQVAAPSGSGDIVRIVGHALTADSIILNISPDWLELA